MKINRILRFQMIASLMMAAILLAGCTQWGTGSNRHEGVDVIPVVSTSHLAINTVNYQVVVQDQGI